MSHSVLFSLSALVAMVPAALVAYRREPARDGVFWLLMAVALAGPAAWVLAQESGAWRTGLSATLWVTVVVTQAVYLLVAAMTRQGWRLAPLLTPYLIVIAAFAAIWQAVPGQALAPAMPTAWVSAHIAVSVVTYGLVTLAAVAALAASLQERALKAKAPTGLTRRLPSVADSEGLVVRLLGAGEVVLGLGLLSGMAVEYLETGRLIALEHKTMLALATFVVIGALLAAHYRVGVRGRAATRLVLVAYLLLTLAYPGVKFVTDVLVA